MREGTEQRKVTSRGVRDQRGEKARRAMAE